MPTLRLVTPAAQADPHPGIDAFENELLDKLDWDGELDYPGPLWSNNDDGQLQTNAGTAKNAGPDVVLVADGSRATDLLLSGNTTKTVIQAVGGKKFEPKPDNLTGFHIDALATAQYQLAHLPSNDVTVMYDPGSLGVYNDLVAFNNKLFIPKHLIPLEINDVDDFDDDDIQGSFMLLPSAKFFNRSVRIAREVRQYLHDNPSMHAVYPEREYKKAHGAGNKQGAHVHGHFITYTFRQAAHLANRILLGQLVIPLPPLEEADRDTGR